MATRAERLANQAHRHQAEFMESLRLFLQCWDEGAIVVYEPDLEPPCNERVQEVIDTFNTRARRWCGLEDR